MYIQIHNTVHYIRIQYAVHVCTYAYSTQYMCTYTYSTQYMYNIHTHIHIYVQCTCIYSYIRALEDASTAINLKSDWPKGHFRKGKALAGLEVILICDHIYKMKLLSKNNSLTITACHFAS